VSPRMENTCFLPGYQEIDKEERLGISIGLKHGTWKRCLKKGDSEINQSSILYFNIMGLSSSSLPLKKA
jgi:hypothetical protein